MFLVEWRRRALNDLAAICLDHPDRWNDIDVAEHDVDYRLRKNPLHFSQPIAEGLRRVISHPLAIYFSVENNQVSVDAVGWVD